MYLAFAEADSGKVWEILRPLLERGCRVWYARGPARSPEEVLRRQARYKGAALTLLYLTDAAVADQNTKSNVLVNQKSDNPILCLDPDDKDRRLAMGLRESVPHIPLYEMRNMEEAEQAILHAEGFSQELLGEPVRIRENSIYSRLSLVFCVLAVAFLLAFLWGAKSGNAVLSKEEDQVEFSDPTVREAVRTAAGGGSITEEAVSGITTITLMDMPESWEDLSLLPALKEIRLPQDALLGDAPLPEGDYTIRLLGGGS